ncbi:MAG: DUF2125 domain-containing protein [Hyphomonadaceae bacterium]|nr:DUF2125 domain-containing protein [Hyphomonadaceae bacterium]
MKNRLWLIIPWALFIALALGWAAYWHYVANRAETQLRAWAEEQTHQGARASYAQIIRHGFPALMRLEIRDLAYAPVRGGWSADTARADLNIDLLNPAHIILEFKAPITVRHDQSVSAISAEALIVSVETRGDALRMAGVEGDAISIDDPEKEGVLGIEKLVVNVRPDPRVDGDYQIAFQAANLRLPRSVRSFEAFGLDVPEARAAIVATHGAQLLESAPDDALAPWRDAGGVLRFEAIALNWGALQATGDGELTVDAEKRLAGHLALPIEQPARVFQALAESPGANDDARNALRLLATAYTLSNNDLTLDVDAANGTLRLEGLPVRSLPPAY